MAMMRLQKFLSAAGVCSRRKGEVLMAAGRVRVNGQTVTVLGTKIDPETDRVEVDGRRVVDHSRLVYLALNKPEGVVTSCEQADTPVVTDLVDLEERVYPIGRLDKDSTGLVLLTNDGPLHHRLLHPSFDHEKEYEVTVASPVPEGALRRLAAGMPLMGTRTRPARVTRLSASRFRIVLQEGKNRQIRRMVRKVGHKVLGLHRIRVANIRLGGLKPGQWRHLSLEEVKVLTAPPASKPPARPQPPKRVKRRPPPKTKPVRRRK
jgi:23S rRNA pseudouridine2605 synthase/23S rRNA pseudouridine2604 synthase